LSATSTAAARTAAPVFTARVASKQRQETSMVIAVEVTNNPTLEAYLSQHTNSGAGTSSGPPLTAEVLMMPLSRAESQRASDIVKGSVNP
jgi:hypothetical protein